jgi:hypothetical protein
MVQLAIVTTIAAWAALLPQVNMCGIEWRAAERHPPAITVTITGEPDQVACAETIVKVGSLKTPTPAPHSVPSECCGYDNINGGCNSYASLAIGGCKQ